MYRHISAYPVKGEAVFTYQINDEEKHTIEVRPYEKEGALKVALVGDETLAGNGTSDWETHGIAAQLETMFEGEEYETAAFIENGAALTDLAPSQECEDFAPDMVVLLAGNREIENWNKDSFSEDYRALLEEYQNMNSSPVVYAVTNPAMHGEGTGELTAENAAAAAAAIREQDGAYYEDVRETADEETTPYVTVGQGGYIGFDQIDLKNGAVQVSYEVKAEQDAVLDIYLDTPEGIWVSSCDVKEDSLWQTVSAEFIEAYGVHSIYIRADQEISLKKIQLKANDSQKYSNDFESGDLAGWQNYEGSWNVSDGAYHGSGNGKSILESMSFSDFIYEVDICVNEATNWGGPVLRVTEPGAGLESYMGYCVNLNVQENLTHRESRIHQENLTHRESRIRQENLTRRESRIRQENLIHRENQADQKNRMFRGEQEHRMEQKRILRQQDRELMLPRGRFRQEIRFPGIWL